MKKYFFIFLFNFFSTHVSTILFGAVAPIAHIPLANVPHLPGPLVPYDQNILDNYNNLIPIYAAALVGNLPHDLFAEKTQIAANEAAVFSVTNHIPPGGGGFVFRDQRNLLQILHSMNDNFRNFVENNFINPGTPLLFSHHVANNLNMLRELIRDRYALVKVEEAVRNGRGVLGENIAAVLPAVIPNGPVLTPNIFRDTLHNLTGRIFVIKTVGHNSWIHGWSSGMIIPYKDHGLFRYDKIVTCCHCIMAGDTDPTLEFYFVRSTDLDPKTGLPPLGAIDVTPGIVNHGQAITDQEFIEYLRYRSGPNAVLAVGERNSVRRIERFMPIGKPRISLSEFSPRYLVAEDGGYGFLNNDGFQLPQVGFSRIKIIHAPPAAGVNVNNYYAIGYPGFRYYQVNPLVDGVLLNQMRYAPFAIMRPPAAAIAHNITLNNGLLDHHAPTMKGMSGGPIVTFSNHGNTINVLGIVSSGYMDVNTACLLP